MGGYVVAHLKRDIVQLGEKLRRILFSKCICFYWFLVFLKFWIFGILNTYFSTTISVISDLVLLSFELRILNFGFFKSHCQPLNFGFFLWSWALKTRLEGSVFFAGGVLIFNTNSYKINPILDFLCDGFLGRRIIFQLVARENVTPRAPGINQTGLHKFPNRGKTNTGNCKSLAKEISFEKRGNISYLVLEVWVCCGWGRGGP